jgi:hypothetical protein
MVSTKAYTADMPLPYDKSAMSDLLMPDVPETQERIFRDIIFLKRSGTTVTHKLFFFANPKSGSQYAAKFLAIEKKEFWVQRPVSRQSMG